jgi:hypothetical protein
MDQSSLSRVQEPDKIYRSLAHESLEAEETKIIAAMP